MQLRFAVPEDAAALLRIYREYIDTTITFEYALPAEAEFAGRIAAFTADGYPYLALFDGEQPASYAYAHRAQERAAYGWNAELSIYIARAYAHHGLGRLLYGTLMELLRLQGVKTVYGVVTSPNPPSEALHAAMGFHRAARFTDAGYKNGGWHDVTWFERELAPRDGKPAPLRPISEIAQSAALLRICEAEIARKFSAKSL